MKPIKRTPTTGTLLQRTEGVQVSSQDDPDDALSLFREQIEEKSEGCDEGCDNGMPERRDAYRGAAPERGHTGTISRRKSELKEEILEDLRAGMVDSPSHDIPVEEDIFYGPGVTAPHSGVYTVVDESGDATGAHRTVVKGTPFPPTDHAGESYTLDRTTDRF